MKQKVFFPLLIITALLLFSCDTAYSRFPMWQGPGGGRENGMFYAIDFTRNRYYTLTATQLAENDYCTIWVETGANVSVGDAKAVAKTYEEDIYPKMITAFGSDEFNAMEVADSYGNGDGKLCILLLNIRDGFNNVSGAYVAGYFTHNDLQANNQNIFDTWYSNESDMIYLNVKPSNHKPNSPNPQDSQNFYNTIAHEMQHLMNYATSLEKRSETGKAPRMMDLWINEGLSSAAESIYAERNLERHVKWYNNDSTGLIANGDNFYYWDYYSHIDNEAVLNDYATVYLFFQWLRIQAGQNLNNSNIYRDIILSDHSDYNAVLDAAIANTGSTWTWDLLLRNWLAANFIKNFPGFGDGYNSEEFLKDVKHRYILENSLTKPLLKFPLLPGEAIYTEKDSVPPASGKIKYASLSGSTISDSGPMPTNGVLLSYNIQTEYTAYTSDWDCYPFSITTTTETNTVTAGVPYRSTTTTHNYSISGGEMLNRKGYSQNYLEAGHSRLITGKKFFNE